MTILLATGEDSGFTGFPQIPTSDTTAGRFRSGYSRCAVTTASPSLATDPPVQRLQLPTFSAGNYVWLHLVFWDNSSAALLNGQSIIFRSPDGVARVIVRAASTTYGTQKVSTRNAAGTFTDLATFSVSYGANTIYILDILVNYSASGGVLVYLNGTLAVNYAGDPRTDSATQLNQVELSNLGSNGNTFYSEIIIADQDTRGMNLWTLPPTAAGNTQAWTPNTVGNINEISNSDGTFVSTTGNFILSEWAVGATPPVGTWSVLALVQEARVQVGATGPQHMDWIVRTAGTDYPAGSLLSIAPSFTNYNHMWPVNPNTGAAWAVTDFTAAGFNYGVQSQT